MECESLRQLPSAKERVARLYSRSSSTVLTVDDTRAARNAVEPGTFPILKDVLPALERGRTGRWHVSKTKQPALMFPQQRARPDSPAVDWHLWSLELA